MSDTQPKQEWLDKWIHNLLVAKEAAGRAAVDAAEDFASDQEIADDANALLDRFKAEAKAAINSKFDAAVGDVEDERRGLQNYRIARNDLREEQRLAWYGQDGAQEEPEANGRKAGRRR